MKEIALTRGVVALVDDADYESLSAHKWRADSYGYAIRSIRDPNRPGKQLTLYMHRLILGLSFGDCRQGDHKDGNRANNRRSNLRIATAHENSRNRRMHSRNRSGAKGVYFCRGRWRARIQADGELKYLGSFERHGDAADAYRIAAVKYHKEFANFG